MASSKTSHGKCLCGAVEIKAEGDSVASVACSCTNCQTCGGAAYTVNLVYPKDTVTVVKGTEDIREYADKNTDSGKTVLRRFCGRCGSGVVSQAEDGQLFIKAPILKGGLETQPSAHIYTRNLPGWAHGSKTGNQLEGFFPQE